MADRVVRPDLHGRHGARLVDEVAESVARRSYGRLLASVASRTRDVTAAEDALADAFVAALVDWRAKGVPRSPEAWLLTVARRKVIDAARRHRSAHDARGHLQLLAEQGAAAEAAGHRRPLEESAVMLVCAHPDLDPGMHAPLLLQTLLGFDAAALAPLFRLSPTAMSQRLVRAKRRLRRAGRAFRPPGRRDLAVRCEAVIGTVRDTLSRTWRTREPGERPRRRVRGGTTTG